MAIFPEFLKDPAEYGKAEALWQERWRGLVDRFGQREQWQTPWINTSFADGTPCRDGNPIFSALCPARHMGIRVIQHEPTSDADRLTFWTSVFGQGEPDAINELVISCELAADTLSDCLQLMNQWLRGEDLRLTTANTPAALAGQRAAPTVPYSDNGGVRPG